MKHRAAAVRFEAHDSAELFRELDGLAEEFNARRQWPRVAPGDDGEEARRAFQGRFRLVLERLQMVGHRGAPIRHIATGRADFRDVVEAGICELRAECPPEFDACWSLSFEAVESVR